MWSRKLSFLLFALAFISATAYMLRFRFFFEYRAITYWGFLIFGGLGLLTNFLGFQTSRKDHPVTNFIFWLGAMLLFFGLISKIMHYPYQMFLVVSGIFVVAISFGTKFFLKRDGQEKGNDLLDS